MGGGGVQSVEFVFLMLLFVAVAFAALAQRLRMPYPIILVIAGLVLSFAPGIPSIALEPDVVFYVFLPPLLYSAAWNTSWREFKFHLVTILLLAIGLVAFTVVGVAATAQWLFSGFDWRIGAVLGAVVSTTDAIAATSIARRLGIERRIVDILEGESLLNDATGLLALEFGVAMLMSGESLHVAEGTLRLGYLIAGGVATGLVVGFVVDRIEHWIDDGPIEIAISILVAYASYFAAEAVDASGVIAVVVSGLYLSRRSVHFFSPGVRIQAGAVWDAITFILNGIVFVLVGLQMRQVLASIKQYGVLSLIRYGLFFAAIVIGLRLIWVFPGAWISWWIRTRLLHQDLNRPAIGYTFVVGWTGMRGVIALAAAISLPATIPHRDLIVFLTFSIILITLVVQGITLPSLIRALGLEKTAIVDKEEFDARRTILESALRHLESIREADAMRFGDVYDDVAQHYRTRLSTLIGEGLDEHGTSAEHADHYNHISRELLGHERRTAVELRNKGTISDETLRLILTEIDLGEARMGHA